MLGNVTLVNGRHYFRIEYPHPWTGSRGVVGHAILGRMQQGFQAWGLVHAGTPGEHSQHIHTSLAVNEPDL